MSAKILVTYTTRMGSTGEIAAAIRDTLQARGLEVDLLPMAEVKDLSGYAAVVAGSPINGSAWLPEASAFVRDNQAALLKKPFATFTVCITLAMKGGDGHRDGVREWVAPIRALVRPVSEGLFAGMVDPSKLEGKGAFGMRLAVTLGIFPRGDRRDWDAIRAWAEALPAKLGV